LQAERPDILIHTIMPGPVDTNFHQNYVNNKKGVSFQQESVEEASSSRKSSSKLKMPVQRCARLIMSAMRRQSSAEMWIAKQPVLAGLYLQQFVPGLMHRLVYSKIGPKRVSMWRAGLDLYDPASWRQSKNTGNGG